MPVVKVRGAMTPCCKLTVGKFVYSWVKMQILVLRCPFRGIVAVAAQS